MTKQNHSHTDASAAKEETITPFIERSITELISLIVQLFTTPFAFLRYNKPFRDQVSALARDDIETAYPETVARPLSFFVLLMGAHFLMSGFYWRLVFPSKSLSQALGLNFSELKGALDRLSGTTQAGTTADAAIRFYEAIKKATDSAIEAQIIIAFGVTLIIATKAYFVLIAGRALHCRIRFKTALHASAYAFGTFIFFQYLFIGIRLLAAITFGDAGFRLGFAIIAYGSLILCIVMVVRVNQMIRQVDGTTELQTYASWLIGTVIWQFVIVLCGIYILQWGGIGDYWNAYSTFWTTFGNVLYPPSWYAG
jgi:hypothetical protein